jgi:hypothetical protein
MSECQINIEHYHAGDITIDPQYIRGDKASVSPFLVVPCMINMKSKFSDSREFLNHYSLINLSGELFFVESQHIKFKIANFNSDPLMHRSSIHGYNQSFTISVPVDYFALKRLEEKRKDKMYLEFQFRFLIAKHPRILSTAETVEYTISSLHTEQSNLVVNIPQSNWIENILNNTGFHDSKLIEVPIPKKIIPSHIYNDALNEIDKANKYYYEGDYDKSSLHCRRAIEIIPDALPYDPKDDRRGYEKRLTIFVEQYLNQTISELKRKKLTLILDTIYSICSDPGHSSQKEPITRIEAEFFIILCSALLSYIGRSVVLLETDVDQG